MVRQLLLKFFFFLLITVAIGCSQKDKGGVYESLVFPIDKEVELEIILDDPIMPELMRDIEFYKGKLVLMYELYNHFIHFFDAETGANMGSALSKGGGPGEIVSASRFWLDRETGILHVFDYMSRILLSGHIDSLYNGKNLSRVNEDFRSYADIFPLPRDGEYFLFSVPIISEPERRYSIKKHNEEIARYDGYPYDDFTLVQRISGTHKMGFNKDMTKLVAALNPGLVMEFFDLKNGIEKTHTRYYLKMRFGNGGMPSYPQSGAGITDFYGTDKYIYSVLGEPTPNIVIDQQARYGNIAIFDWEGNPLKIFRTKYKRLKKICVDDDERILYTIGERDNGEYVLARFDLSKH